MFLIAGDSWGCGELPESGLINDITHLGFTQYLREYEKTINICNLGGTNLESSNKIRWFLGTNPGIISKVIVWQTEWDRDIIYRPRSDFQYGYEVTKSRWIESFYQHLAETYSMFKIPIHIIGGCSDTEYFNNISNDYPGLNILCQSATNLILKGDQTINEPVFCEFLTNQNFVTDIKSHTVSDSDLASLIKDMDLGQNRLKLFEENPELFYPDGIHPNRKAQRILFDFVADRLFENQ